VDRGSAPSGSPASWIDGWATNDETALWFEGAEVTYATLARRIDEVAAALVDLGVSCGDRVSWVGLNRVELFEVLFACARVGAIFNPLNNRLTARELGALVAAAAPTVILTADGFGDTAAQAVVAAGSKASVRDLDVRPLVSSRQVAHGPVDPEDPLIMVFTSGTTGRPKGAVLSHRAVGATVANGVASQRLDATDVIIAPLPTFHVGGLNIQTLPTLQVGGTVVLMRRFDPGEVLDLIERFRPTQALLVPAMLTAVSGHPGFAAADLTCFTGVMSGSSVVLASVTDPWFDRGVPIGQVYGTTETGPTAVVLDYDHAAAHPGSAGLAVAPSRIRIVDETGAEVEPGRSGEILVQGPNLFTQYWEDPRATAQAMRGGWYHTGDVGHVDEDGWLFVSDRLRDMLISGGENVYPAEVEGVLIEHPRLAEVAVVGRPDERLGEVGVAFVVPTDMDEAPTLEELRSWAGDRLARFKHPRELVIVDELPRTALGKVTKHVLRERLV